MDDHTYELISSLISDERRLARLDMNVDRLRELVDEADKANATYTMDEVDGLVRCSQIRKLFGWSLCMDAEESYLERKAGVNARI